MAACGLESWAWPGAACWHPGGTALSTLRLALSLPVAPTRPHTGQGLRTLGGAEVSRLDPQARPRVLSYSAGP